jgi:hypothetical protein
MTNHKAFYINTGDKYEVYKEVNNFIASFDNKEEANTLLQMLNNFEDMDNNNIIPNPYEGPPNMTDCEIWSDDIIKLLHLKFNNINYADGTVTRADREEASESLRSALIWYYQTHL